MNPITLPLSPQNNSLLQKTQCVTNKVLSIGWNGCPKVDSGFTLLEVVAAITILAMGVTAILSSFNNMHDTHRAIQFRGGALLVARNLVSLVRTEDLTPNSQNNEGQTKDEIYRYKVAYEETGRSGLYSVSITVEWGDEDSPGRITLNTLQFFN